jgi:hypothetical protein
LSAGWETFQAPSFFWGNWRLESRQNRQPGKAVLRQRARERALKTVINSANSVVAWLTPGTLSTARKFRIPSAASRISRIGPAP